MMVNAIKQIIDIPTEIITFSDDMDGLEKFQIIFQIKKF